MSFWDALLWKCWLWSFPSYICYLEVRMRRSFTGRHWSFIRTFRACQELCYSGRLWVQWRRRHILNRLPEGKDFIVKSFLLIENGLALGFILNSRGEKKPTIDDNRMDAVFPKSNIIYLSIEDNIYYNNKS